MSHSEVPQVIGKCRLLEQIGEGGMGAVYKGYHPDLDLDVAIKLLPEHLARDPATADRFLREARLAVKLDHPNIIRVIDCGRDQGRYYLVMEFVDGQNVAKLVEQTGPLSVERALEITQLTTGALHYALDELGLIHRDIKPENIMLTQFGHVKLADLGLAKLIQDEEIAAGDETGPHLIALGTPIYMCPEQFVDAENVDHRADIYSLGVTLYHLLTGRFPITATNMMDLLVKVRDESPAPLPDSIPQPVRELIERMMEKEPQDRPQTYAELLRMIEAVQGEDDEVSELGKLAVLRGLATPSQVDECLAVQKSRSSRGDPVRLGELLVARGYLDPDQLETLLQEQGHAPTTPRFGQYEFLARLEESELGSSYKVRHVETGRDIVLKLLPKPLARDPGAVRRFDREAAVLLGLDHPNIVRGIESGYAGGYHYLALEYVEGETLEQMMARRARAGPLRVLEIALEICKALAFAHGRGLVHGDIRPANILLARSGQGKLAGFGEGRPSRADIARGAIPIETAYYLAPERCTGQAEPDIRADLYSVGAVIFHAVTGSPPYEGDFPLAVIQNIISQPVPAARERFPHIGRDLAELLEKVMAKAPEERPESPTALLRALEHVRRSARKKRNSELLEVQRRACSVCGEPLRREDRECPTCGIRLATDSDLDVQPSGEEIKAARLRAALNKMASKSEKLQAHRPGLTVQAMDLLRRKCSHCGTPRNRKILYCGACWAYLGYVCPGCMDPISWGTAECESCGLHLGRSRTDPPEIPNWAR